MLNDYPLIQGSGGLCWAAAVASMLEYETGGMFSPGRICDALHIPDSQGGTTSDVVFALEMFLPSTYDPKSYDRVMTNSEIRTIINNDDPACMLAICTDNNDVGGRATVLCGYSRIVYSGNILNTISFMEPHYACIRTISSDSSSITYSIDNYEFKWTETVRLLYA